MSDRLDKLRAALTELEAELKAGSLDAATRAELAAAVAHIETALGKGERSVASRQAEDSLQNRLVDFEASHPQLAIIVSRLLDGLAQLGI